MKDIVCDIFQLEDRDVREISALSLAFLGDAVYELVIRTVLAERGGRPREISEAKARLVNAGTQAGIARRLLAEGCLTEEEAAAFRRGRNANPHTLARHASVGDYHNATGLETLMGTLYLQGQTARLTELIRRGLEGEHLWK